MPYLVRNSSTRWQKIQPGWLKTTTDFAMGDSSRSHKGVRIYVRVQAKMRSALPCTIDSPRGKILATRRSATR